MNIFSNKIVRTEFRDILPNHRVYTNLFDNNAFQQIQNNGLNVSPLKIIHSASVHYQTRFRSSPSMRFINAFVEIVSSLSNLPNDNNFYLNSEESGEFQAHSTEVLGVGFSVALTSKLFAINKNRIMVIEDSGKRCDLSFEKNNLEYIIESKGRQKRGQIKKAIDYIFEQKNTYPHSRKYGIVSFLPRDRTPISLIVVDPENVEVPINRDDLILRLLKYYSAQSTLAGFWRLSSLLNSRIKQIELGVPISEFEGRSLDYQNIIKMGRGYSISFQDYELETFFNVNDNIGFRYQTERKQYFYALDKQIIQILESQDYSELLNYTYKNSIDTTVSIRDNSFSINNDGTIFAAVNRDELNI